LSDGSKRFSISLILLERERAELMDLSRDSVKADEQPFSNPLDFRRRVSRAIVGGKFEEST